MTTQPTSHPAPLPQPRLLTAAAYLALGETEPGYTELVEGRLITSPSPVFDHNYCGFELCLALRRQLPSDLVTVQDLDVDLELAPPGAPGFVRRPDLIVVRRDARARVRRDGGLIRASEVVVAVELVSPSSHRTDHVAKRSEYADAGIPHYWIVELGKPVTLLACHLAGEFGYADGGVVAGTFRTTEPFAFELRLDDLR